MLANKRNNKKKNICTKKAKLLLILRYTQTGAWLIIFNLNINNKITLAKEITKKINMYKKKSYRYSDIPLTGA